MNLRLKKRRQIQNIKKLKLASLISIRCNNCYNFQVFTPEGEFKKPDAVRSYLLEQKCQFCKINLAEVFSQDIVAALKRITFLESCFGEIFTKNNFVHFLSNISYPTPFVLLPQPA